MRQKAHPLSALAVCLAAITTLVGVSAEAYTYRRPQDNATPGAPTQHQPTVHMSAHHVGTGQSDVNFAWNGMEGPAYAYGYGVNMPADGNWRWIEPRCYSTRGGDQTCVDGHWLRRAPGRCEEVTTHAVRRGQYIRIMPNGPVSTCRR